MADTTLSITVKEADAIRVINAMDGLYGGRAATAYTKAQWVKVQVLKFLKDSVRTYEAMVAADAARATAEAATEANIT